MAAAGASQPTIGLSITFVNLSTKHLKAFKALATEKNFTKAASQCHLTQPALSVLIQNLEEQVGAKLFERNTRNVMLTPEGLLFDAFADKLLDDFEHALSELRQHVSKKAGHVTVAALPSVAVGSLIPAVAQFNRIYPGVSVAFIDVTADECLSLVKTRKADFAVTFVGEHHPELISQPLCSDSFYVVCSTDHPLAASKKLRQQDILAHPVIQFVRSTSIRQHLDASFYPEKLITHMEVSNLSTVAGLVANNMGISIVPGLSLFLYTKPDIAIIPLELEVPNRMICLVQARDRVQSVAAQALITHLKETIRA